MKTLRLLILSLILPAPLFAGAPYLFVPTNDPGIVGQQIFSSGIAGYYKWDWGTNAASSNATVISKSASIDVTTNGFNFTPFITLTFSNWVAAFGTGATNEALLIGANGTNNVLLSGLNDTNQSLLIGANGTNEATRVSNNATNQSLKIGSGATNQATVVSNALYLLVTNVYVAAGTGGSTNASGQNITYTIVPGSGGGIAVTRTNGILLSTNGSVVIISAGITNGANVTFTTNADGTIAISSSASGSSGANQTNTVLWGFTEFTNTSSQGMVWNAGVLSSSGTADTNAMKLQNASGQNVFVVNTNGVTYFGTNNQVFIDSTGNLILALGSGYYGLVPSGGETNAAGSRVAYLSDVGAAAVTSTNGILVSTNGSVLTVGANIAATDSSIVITTNSGKILIQAATQSGADGIATNSGAGYNNTLTNLTVYTALNVTGAGTSNWMGGTTVISSLVTTNGTNWIADNGSVSVVYPNGYLAWNIQSNGLFQVLNPYGSVMFQNGANSGNWSNDFVTMSRTNGAGFSATALGTFIIGNSGDGNSDVIVYSNYTRFNTNVLHMRATTNNEAAFSLSSTTNNPSPNELITASWGTSISNGVVAHTITVAGTAGQITSSTGTAQQLAANPSTTLALASPLLAPGIVSATGLTNTAFAAVGVVTNDAGGKLYTTPTLPNALLANSSVTFSGTAGQITGGGATALGASATPFAIASPLVAPGIVSATGLTNTGFSAIGVVTNDANGKLYTTPSLPNPLLQNSAITINGTSTSLGGTASLNAGTLTNVNAGALTGGVWRVDIRGDALYPADAGGMAYTTNTPGSANNGIQGAGPSDQMWQITTLGTNCYAKFPLPYTYDGGTITAELWFTGGTNFNTKTTNVVTASASVYGTALGTAKTLTNRVDTVGVTTYWRTNSQISAITIAGSPVAGDLVIVQFAVNNTAPQYSITNNLYAHHASVWGTCSTTQQSLITQP